MSINPPVSIILPVLDGAAHLRALLPLLEEQNYGGDIEILAIDSASSDDSVAVLQSHGARIISIERHEFGHGKTRNQGVTLAQGEIVVFLSQDALPIGPDWLRYVVAPLQDRAVGATFARQLPRPDATPLEKFFQAHFYPQRSRVTCCNSETALTLDKIFFSNVCSAARREVCERFPFDETLIMSEDQIFARDLLRAGLKIHYEARAQVVHSHSYTLRGLFRRSFDSGYSLRALQSPGISRQIRRVARFLGSEISYLVHHRQFSWLAFLPFYEATRFSALLLGSCAPILPRRWCMRLSLHRAFWQK